MAEPHDTWSTRPPRTLEPGEPTPDSNGDPPEPSAEAGAPGSFGRFALLRELGKGGMGVVYTAYDHLLDRRVAIKVVRTDRGDAHGRILREAKALAQLSHPNVVQVYDVGASSSEQIYIAMEFVDGVTLRGRLPELGGWPLAERRREILGLFIQAGEGLAAAHAAGLVHRDFKPDNVLVGADGRARVVDFGLVRTSDARSISVEAAALEPSLIELSDYALTLEGTLLGTPLYMSPEHFAGQADDPRSDQFSFCAALYEALLGERPFAGKDLGELRKAVLCGELRDPGGAVPPWLAEVLRRGLARRPRDRFPSMRELLIALADDPAEARRRRLRLTALVVGAALTSVALVLAISAGIGSWNERRREEDAAAALEIVEARIGSARAAGDGAAAARIFAAFVDEPLYAETDAIARAWLREAERRRDDGEPAAASSAFASAYFEAHADALRIDALTGLAELAREALDWDRLQRIFAVLGRDHPEAGAEPRLRDLQVDVDLARGDYGRAAAHLPFGDPRRSTIAALRGATVTPHIETAELLATIDIDGDGTGELLFSTWNGSDIGLLITAADPSLTLIREHAVVGDINVFAVEHERGPLLVAGEGGSLTLRSIGGGGELTPLFARPAPSAPFAAASVDLDGDGVREVYVGTGTDLEILELRVDDDGGWHDRVVYSPRESLDSAAYQLLPIDLDGDGRPELVAAFEGWRAYDVRLLRRDPSSGRLITVDRDKLGTTSGAAEFRLGDAVGVLVKKTNGAPNTLVFPPDRPRGEPDGLYFYRGDAGHLSRTRAFALPVPATASLRSSSVLRVADFDGDGLDDVAVPFLVDEIESTLVVRQDRAGALHSQVFAGVQVVGTAELDGDPQRELLVNIKSGGAPRLWALGVGDQRPEVAAAAAPFHLPALVDPDDPAWSQGWRGAVDLAAIGVDRDAAAAFHDLAKRSGSSELRSQALLAAGELHDRAGEHLQARDAYLAAAEGPSRQGALRGALRAQLRLGEHEAARASADALLALGDLEVAEQVELRRLTAEAPRVDLTFDAPLDHAWRIHEPLALARDPEGGALRITTATAGLLASLPLEWPGGLLDLEVDMRVVQSEWSSGLTLRIVAEGSDQELVSTIFSTSGTSRGGQEPTRHYLCTVGRKQLWTPGKIFDTATDHSDHVGVRTFVSELLGEVGCNLRNRESGGSRSQRASLPIGLPRAGLYRLELVAHQDVPAWLELEIRRITIQGARLAPAAADEHAAFARALSERDAAAALAVAPPQAELGPRGRLWLADALLRMGQVQKAMSLWPASIADDEAAAALIDLYRGRPELYDPLLRSHYGAGYPAWAATIWRDAAVNHLSDRRVHADLLRALGGEAPIAADADDDERERAAELLGWRARLSALTHRPEAARADFLAALGLLTESARADEPDLRERRALLLIDLAALEAETGAEVGARDRAREALRVAPTPALIDDVLRARPALARIAVELLGASPSGPRPPPG